MLIEVGFLDFGAGVGVHFLGFRVGLVVGLGKDGVVNILSSCCLDISS